MQFLIHRLSSLLAIAGGAMFLVLPVAFMSGVASIAYPPLSFRCPPDIICLLPFYPYRQPPLGMAPSWVAMGTVGILLGLLVLKLSPRPRVGVGLGLLFSLGAMTFLFWIVTRNILETFVTTPAAFLAFPELSVVAMAAGTLLFFYELLRRGRELIDAITS